MNKLILIVKGFDLAHGLKTSYNDFILDHLKKYYFISAVFIICSCQKIDNCHSNFMTTDPALVTKIEFGSCASQHEDQPILNTIVDKKPELFIYLGDNIYGDTRNMIKLEKEYYKLCSKPEFQHLISSVRVLATWDDHDYGENDAGKDYPMKDISKVLFLNFWGEQNDDGRWEHTGVYTSYFFGDTAHLVQIILLDCRTFRDPLLEDDDDNYIPNTSDQATMLGQQQWDWLKTQLQKPAKLRIIGSSTQFLRSYNTIEAWANFPKEQQKMYSLFQTLHINNALFISGDVHLAELSKIEVSGVHPLLDLTSSGLTDNKEQNVDIPNSNRIENSVYNETNFGMIEIDWDHQPLQINFKVYNGAGVERMDHVEYY